MTHRIVIHYSEIGTKGKNREYFENALVRNVRRALGEGAGVKRRFGRIVCEPRDGLDPTVVRERLARLPGIAYFTVAVAAEADPEAIVERAVELLAPLAFETFGVEARRADKSFPLTSSEINIRVGSAVVTRLGKKVNLSSPDVRLTVEVTHREAYLYTEKVPGPGGLPVGTSGTVLASLSGGIDSPVAAYLMMKRGCRVVFGHVRNETQFRSGVEDKIRDLVRELTGFQLRSRLYVLPFGDLQRRIIAFVPAKYRMIVYRRFMMRLLEGVARREGAQALVTGDSVGQVASQTLENIACIRAATALPVLSPLVGMNKEEITAVAKAIGTYGASIEPYPDCCSFMIAPHPETRADPELIARCEGALEGADELVEACLAAAEVEDFEIAPP
ncbi:MAG: tRNA 4-thiouridine(8) synthase ThiI [Deferrisomatales bacterium]